MVIKVVIVAAEVEPNLIFRKSDGCNILRQGHSHSMDYWGGPRGWRGLPKRTLWGAINCRPVSRLARSGGGVKGRQKTEFFTKVPQNLKGRPVRTAQRVPKGWGAALHASPKLPQQPRGCLKQIEACNVVWGPQNMCPIKRLLWNELFYGWQRVQIGRRRCFRWQFLGPATGTAQNWALRAPVTRFPLHNEEIMGGLPLFSTFAKFDTISLRTGKMAVAGAHATQI